MKTGIYWQDPEYAVGRCHRDPGLVLYLPLYQLDGASFRSKDAYGHLGTVTGALWQPDGRLFDRVDDRMVIPHHTALRAGTAFTIMFWIYWRVTELNGYADIYQKGDTYVAGGEFYLGFRYVAVGARTLFYCRLRKPDDSGSIIRGYEWTSNKPVDKWVHIAVVYDGENNTLLLYEDLVDRRNPPLNWDGDADGLTSVYAGTSDVIIGDYYSFPFGGYLGELWHYNRVLNPQEIQRHYLAGKWRYR